MCRARRVEKGQDSPFSTIFQGSFMPHTAKIDAPARAGAGKAIVRVRALRAVVTACGLLVLAACGGGGGGGGGPALTLSFSPARVDATFFAGTAYPFAVTATVTGTVSGTVVVVIEDTVGVIQPNVQVTQQSERVYVANFVTLTSLTPGRYTGNIAVRLCSTAACSTRYGSRSLPFDFTVLAAPAITQFEPAQWFADGGSFLLTVAGTGFTPQSVVTWQGSARQTIFEGTTLVAAIEAGDVEVAGPVQIAVRTTQAGAPPVDSAAASLLVINPEPQVTMLAPTGILIDSPDFTLTVSGSGFRPESQIVWAGVPLVTTFASGTQLTTNIPTGALGLARLVPITVTTPGPGGGTSAAVDFAVENPVPVAVAMDPGFTSAGCGTTTVAVRGSGFVGDTTLRWNGSPRPTTVLSATRVTAVIEATELGAAGTASIAVVTPGPGGGASQALTFPISAPGTVTSSAVSYQSNPQHTGEATVACPNALPEAPTWTYAAPFGSGILGTPLVAGGKVFARRTTGSFPNLGTEVLSLEQVNGALAWGPVAIAGESGFAYDDGVLFVASVVDDTDTATVRAFDADSGSLLWAEPIPGPHQIGPMYPVAANGHVYVVRLLSPAAAFALDQATGDIVWSNPFDATAAALPAVAGDGVFLGYSCEMRRLDAATGTTVWIGNNGCSGGGWETVIVAGNRAVSKAFVPGGGVFDYVQRNATTGSSLGTFAQNGRGLPAFRNGVRFSIHDGILRAVNVANGMQLWQNGSGLDEAPLVVNDSVLASVPSGGLYAFDAATGAVRWFGAGSGLLTQHPDIGGLAVGDGLLVVPRGTTLRAYRIGPAP
jgi:outer membrane protein assembly factor BamB